MIFSTNPSYINIMNCVNRITFFSPGHFDKNFKILPFPRNDLFRSLCSILLDLWWPLESRPVPFLVYSSFQMTKISTKFRKSTWTLLFQQICFTGFSSFTDSDRLSPRFSLEGLKHQPMRGPYLNLDQSATSTQKKWPDFRVIAEKAKYWKHWPTLPSNMPNSSSWFPEKNNYLPKDKILDMNEANNINQSRRFHFSINLHH